MTRDSIITALLPSRTFTPGLLAHFAAAIEAELTALEREFLDVPVRGFIVASRDEYAALSTEARRRVNGEDAEAIAELGARFVQAVHGRDRFERLLSVHLGAGFVRDALRQLVGWELEVGRIDASVADELGALLEWDAAQAPLVEALLALFEEDITLDDRLAMWGRRIAGDAAVWGRELLGIAPGATADSVVAGSEEIVEEFQAGLMAEHSRRMNALRLAA